MYHLLVITFANLEVSGNMTSSIMVLPNEICLCGANASKRLRLWLVDHYVYNESIVSADGLRRARVNLRTSYASIRVVYAVVHRAVSAKMDSVPIL